MRRRDFLLRSLDLGRAAAAALVAAAVAPAAWFWWRSARRPVAGGAPWLDLGMALEVPEGRWLRKPVTLERRNRWRVETAEELIYVRRDDRTFTIFSGTCPHNGCLVRLEDGDGKGGFACPCHKSAFDAAGRIVDGPSPRGLDALEWKVEERHLRVRFQRFRPGTASPEPLDA